MCVFFKNFLFIYFACFLFGPLSSPLICKNCLYIEEIIYFLCIASIFPHLSFDYILLFRSSSFYVFDLCGLFLYDLGILPHAESLDPRLYSKLIKSVWERLGRERTQISKLLWIDRGAVGIVGPRISWYLPSSGL